MSHQLRWQIQVYGGWGGGGSEHFSSLKKKSQQNKEIQLIIINLVNDMCVL